MEGITMHKYVHAQNNDSSLNIFCSCPGGMCVIALESEVYRSWNLATVATFSDLLYLEVLGVCGGWGWWPGKIKYKKFWEELIVTFLSLHIEY
jgi:hypothetical protein